MLLKRLSISILFLMACQLAGLAYRPLGIEDAGVAGLGVGQTEISFDYLKWSDGKTERDLLLVPIYGLTENLEVSAEIPYLFHANTDGTSPSGMGDVNLVIKELLLSEGEQRPALAVKGVVKLDNGSFAGGLGSGDKDYSLVVVVSKTFDRFIVHSHLGYTWVGKAQSAALRDISLYGLAVDYSLADSWRLLTEINGNRHPDSTAAEDPRNWLVGVACQLSDRLVWDLAGRGGLSNSSPEWSLTTGFSAIL